MRNGFTLVELLVALAIFSLLATAGVAVLGQSVTAQAVLRERAEEVARFTRMRALMRNDLEQAAARPTRDATGRSSGEPFVGGTGGSDGPLLAFVRRGWENPDGAARPSLQLVEYRVADGRLERVAHPMLDGGVPEAPQVLMTGVREVELAYRLGGQWLPRWPVATSNLRGRLPQAVRIEMQVDGLGSVRQLFLVPGGA